MAFNIENKITKIFRIVKWYSSGKTVHHIIVTAEEEDSMDAEAEYSAENWANRDPSGHGNGYRIEWEEETDPIVISRVISTEKENTERQMKTLSDRLQFLSQMAKAIEGDVTIKEDCPDGYWYSLYRGSDISFNTRACNYSDLLGIQDGSSFDVNNCLVVTEAEYDGCIIDKKHANFKVNE